MATDRQIQRVKGLTRSPDPLLTMREVRAVHAVCDEVEQLRERVEAAEEVVEDAESAIFAWDGNDDVEPNFAPLRRSLARFRDTEGEQE